VITGTFAAFGYRTAEINLVPALGLALLAAVVCLLAVHT
jgi:hypothetical protein